MAYINLIDFLTLNDDEQMKVDLLRSTVETIISRLATNKKYISQCQSQPNYSQVNALHPLMRDRMLSANSAIDADHLLLSEEIGKVDLGLLIKSAINNPIFDELLHNPALDPYWNERWRKSGRNPEEKADMNQSSIHEYKPQSTLHTFELLKGAFIYSQYFQLITKDKELAESYLQLAAQLRNYTALSVLYRRHFKEPEVQGKALFCAQVAAESYWTPGYILLALLSYQQGNYQDALLHLIIAEKLIPYSENMLNNAYQGKSLDDVVRPLLDTLKARSITDVKIQLAQLAKLPTYFVTQSLYSQAHTKVKALLDSAKTLEQLPQRTLHLEVQEKKGHDITLSL